MKKNIYMTAKVFKENALQHDNEEIYIDIYLYIRVCVLQHLRNKYESLKIPKP